MKISKMGRILYQSKGLIIFTKRRKFNLTLVCATPVLELRNEK